MRIVCILFLCLLSSVCQSQESLLDTVQERGYLRVGTPGDYEPFSAWDGQEYRGYDIELAKIIARELEVELRIEPTTWENMVSDLEKGSFDMVVGGVTRTLARQRRAAFTHLTFTIGKCPLVRSQDSVRFNTWEKIDQPEVRIAANPGGTNEAYIRSRVQQAQIVLVSDNLAIPELIAKGEVDLLITDNIEALVLAGDDPRLAAVSAGDPWTRESLGLMLPRDDQAFLNWVNLLLEQAEADGRLGDIRLRYDLSFPRKAIHR